MGKSNDILSEDKHYNSEKYPKSFHFCLLPPSQFTFHFDYFGIHSISVNDAIPIYYLFFGWNRPFLGLIGE